MDELAQVLALLGVPSTAEAANAINKSNGLMATLKKVTGKSDASEAFEAAGSAFSFARAIETATGKAGDEAVGLIRAALASHEALPALQARVAELEASTEQHTLNDLIAKATAEHKVTKAIEDNVRASFAAKEITLKGAEMLLSNLHPISALQPKSPPASPASSTAPSANLQWNGKTYAQLSGTERVELKKEQPELFAQMRAGFKPGDR